MIEILKYTILFVVYGFMMLNRMTTSNEIAPEIAATEYFGNKSDQEIENIIFSKPLTLIYFHSHGLAEPLRYIMYYAEMEFVDKRISEDEWRSQYKGLMPFGQLPVLKIDVESDKSIYLHQSVALCRYLAKRTNLIGDNSPWTLLLIDKIVGNIEDFLQEFKTVYYEENKTQKDNLIKDLIDVKIPKFMTTMEEIAEKNSGYFVQNKLTWADIYGVPIFDFMGKFLEINIYNGYTNLMQLRQKVNDIKQISEALVKRDDNLSQVLFPRLDEICVS